MAGAGLRMARAILQVKNRGEDGGPHPEGVPGKVAESRARAGDS